jgi:DNA repair exonuclease SbcCD ATPase subunit
MALRFKRELRKYGLPVEDTRKFVNAIRWIQGAGYNAVEIIGTYSDIVMMRQARATIEAHLSRAEQKLDALESEISSLQERRNASTQTISELETLKALGLGLKELRYLHSLINEIASANRLPIENNSALQKLFADLRNQYDAKLGFERTIIERQNQIKNLTHGRDRYSLMCGAIPFVPLSINSLKRRGVTEDEIVRIAHVLEKIQNKDIESIIRYIEERTRMDAVKAGYSSNNVQNKNQIDISPVRSCDFDGDVVDCSASINSRNNGIEDYLMLQYSYSIDIQIKQLLKFQDLREPFIHFIDILIDASTRSNRLSTGLLHETRAIIEQL